MADGIILTSSRLPDGQIRTVAKAAPLVVLNRLVDQVASVATDNIRAVKKVVELLAGLGHKQLTYLAGRRGVLGRREALARPARGRQ